MSVLNESLQWAALIVLGGAILGLYRQLANFLIPRREQVALAGPDVGARLPKPLLGDASDRFAEQLRRSPSGIGLVGVLSGHCPGCQDAIRVLRMDTGLLGDVCSALVVDSHSLPDFVEQVAPLADVVVDDPHLARAYEAGIHGWPFFLVVDREMRVRARAITSDVLRLVSEARQEDAEASLASA